MHDFLKMVGRRIVASREKRGWGAADLARETGVAASTLGRWENGESDPKCEGLAAIAKACEVTVDYLLGLSEQEQRLPEGWWVVDMDLVRRVRNGGEVPEGEFLGCPVPRGAALCSSKEYDRLLREVQHLTKGGRRRERK